MNREQSINRIREQRSKWDVAIIGGGATGVGIAVDAASRGYSVCLFEQSDFGKATSSRSTKLVHGGVRYLKQGNISLVLDALRERGILRANAPHLVRDLSFVIPAYHWSDQPFYAAGLKLYDSLAGKRSFGKSRLISRRQSLDLVSTLQPQNLRGGVLYHDGQFDDARLLINLAQTATNYGAALLNYAKVTGFLHEKGGKVIGLAVEDQETREQFDIRAKCVINATGVFADSLRTIDNARSTMLIAASQGTHIVLPQSFLPGNTAIMVPKTPDGRVMFAIPWLGHVLVGTTDVPVTTTSLEPIPQPAEIDFLLQTAGRYLVKPPTRADILSVFAGIRPLVRQADRRRTASLSRDHTIEIASSGLITIVGGKWTTYRKMAEDCVDHAVRVGELAPSPCVTAKLRIHDSASQLANLPQERLHASLPISPAHIIAAVRYEMARTLDDMLARRTRALHLNSAVAMELAEPVARIMSAELGKTRDWESEQIRSFMQIASNYRI